MCFDIGIVTCGPNEALVISGMCQVILERNKADTCVNIYYWPTIKSYMACKSQLIDNIIKLKLCEILGILH